MTEPGASSLLVQLAVASVMVFITVLIHGAGIAALARRLQFDPSGQEHHQHFSPSVAFKVLSVVFGLFGLHGLEIWLYAGLYLYLGAVRHLEGALYFSTITYAAIGYDDSAMSIAWRLVSAIEGVNGLLLLGWSTAFFVTVVARLRR